MKRAIGLTAGLADSGFAAIANLGAGVFAIHTLSTDNLALYSLFFAGWVTSQLLPAQLSYLPARLAINSSVEIVGPRVQSDLRQGLVPILAAPALVTLAGLPLISSTTPRHYIAVAASVAILTLVAPFQDHIRRCLHTVNKHPAAAICSGVTFAAVAATLTVSFLVSSRSGGADLSPAVTFLALAVGNFVGACFGLICLSRVPKGSYLFPPFRTRLSYLGPELTGQASGYAVNVIAAAMLGTSGLASLETARIMSSPVAVVVTGISAYLIPETVRLYVRYEFARFRRMLMAMTGAIVSVGALYCAILLVGGRYISVALGDRADNLLGASRAVVGTVDSAAPGSAMILFTANKSGTWNAIAVASSVVTLVLVVPSILWVGTFGVILAQFAGALFKSTAGLTASIRSTDQATGLEAIQT